MRSGLTFKAAVFPETPSFGSGFSEPYPSPEWSLSALRGYIPVVTGKQGQGEHPLCASATDPLKILPPKQ